VVILSTREPALSPKHEEKMKQGGWTPWVFTYGCFKF